MSNLVSRIYKVVHHVPSRHVIGAQSGRELISVGAISESAEIRLNFRKGRICKAAIESIDRYWPRKWRIARPKVRIAPEKQENFFSRLFWISRLAQFLDEML